MDNIHIMKYVTAKDNILGKHVTAWGNAPNGFSETQVIELNLVTILQIESIGNARSIPKCYIVCIWVTSTSKVLFKLSHAF